MNELLKGHDENPDRELGINAAKAHRDGLVDNPRFLSMLVDTLRPALLQVEPRLTPDGGAVVGASVEVELFDKERACGVTCTVILQARMVEHEILDPGTPQLVMPGDTSISSLVEPRPGMKLH